VTFTATDNGSPVQSASETITITVTNTNRAPVLAAIGNKSVAENALLTFTISATDADGDTLTYSATGLPTGATFDAATRTFSWTPTYAQGGSYPVTFTATDNGSPVQSASETITITVTNVNRAPVLTAIGDKTVAENALLTFIVTATDADGDTLTYSATGLPTGATFNPSTRIFNWTPTYAQSGSYPVTFTATDNGTPVQSASETITITVTNVNRAPVLAAIGNKSVAENALLTFTISATDADGDTITYSATGLPTGATFDAATRTFSWTPGYTQAGSYPVTFTATDNGSPVQSASETITITVTNVNAAPELAAIGNKTVAENALLTFTVSATDADNDTLTYSATGLPTGATFNPATRTFSWTPSYTQSGTYPVTFTVTDSATPALSDSETITITVTNVNRAPTLTAIGNKTVAENALLTFTISATDADGDTLTYSATGLPTGATFTPATRTFSWTPTYAQSGSYPVTFTATDNGSPVQSASETITITVTNVNRAPVATADSVTVAEDSGATSVAVRTNDTDADGDTLTVTVVTQGTNGAVAITGGGTAVSYTPNANYFGSDSFTYTISDGNGGTATGTVTVTVTSVNDAPTAVNDAATVPQNSAANTIDVRANDSFAPDTGETLTVTVVSQGTKGVVAISGGGTAVTYDPNTGATGTDSFTYTISDGNGGTATATVNVTIQGQPTVSIDDVSLEEGNSGLTDFVFNVTLSNSWTSQVTVNYATVNGTARSGLDYQLKSGQVTIPIGATSATVTIKVIGETTKEVDETFRVRLSNAVNATIADLEGIATIIDDDNTPQMMMSGGSSPEGGGTLSSGSTSTTTSSTGLMSTESLLEPTTELNGGRRGGDDLRPGETQRSVTFTVSLSNASEIPLSVAYQTVDGSAVAGLDYTPVSGVLAFAEDETVKTVTVMVSPDALHEFNEGFALKFSNPVAVVMPKDTDTAPAQIEDDDAAPNVDVTDVSVVEGNDGVTKAVFTVTMTSVSGKGEMVKYATSNGTALAGVDYEATSGYLVFEPGVNTATVSVAVMGDKEPEQLESFFLNLVAASDATIARLQGVATIVDDDAAANWTTSTLAEFQKGVADKGAYLAEIEDGEVLLAPTVGDEFFGTALSTAWTVAGTGAGGVKVGGGLASLDARQISQGAGLYNIGRTLEFEATFTGDDTQYVGFNLLLFTADNLGNLYAQTSAPKNNTMKTLIPGKWVGAPHRYRITWGATNVVYAIDGVVVATHVAAWPANQRMYPVARDMFTGTVPMSIDWLRLSGYVATGTYTSQVFDAGSPIASVTPTWEAELPAGTTVTIEVRSGNTPVVDASWTPLTTLPLVSGVPIAVAGQYVQFKATLKTAVATATPVLKQVVISYQR
jgi:hypothetical protein